MEHKNKTYTLIYIVCKKIIDKKIISSILIGLSIASASIAIAQTQNETSLLSSVKNWFNTSINNSQNNNLSTTSSISTELEAELAKCAKGEAGTLGAAIKNASKMHQQIAAIAPPVEELFEGDCFSGIMAIFDLSFAIPSLASIMSAVTQAVIQFAQKKVCRAIHKASKMISDPINQAIGTINSFSNAGDLNGLVNGMVMQGLDNIDPELGQAYLPAAPSGSYVVNTNPFSLGQTSFETGVNLGTNYSNNLANTNNANVNLYNNMNNLNEAQKTMGANQQKILQLIPSITQTSQTLQICNNNNNNCQGLQNQYNDLMLQKQQLEAQNAQLQNNVIQGNYTANKSNHTSSTNIQQPNTSDSQNLAKSSNSSWFNFNFLNSK